MSGMRVDRGLGEADAHLTVDLERGAIDVSAYRLADEDEIVWFYVIFRGPRGGGHGGIRFDCFQADYLRQACLALAHRPGSVRDCLGQWDEQVVLRKAGHGATSVAQVGPKGHCRYSLEAINDDLTDIAAAIRFCTEEVRP